MRVELPCKIVEDLLPLYIDELTNDTTSESVNYHLDQCDHCRQHYLRMKNGEWNANSVDLDRSESEIDVSDAEASDYAEKVEINFLKKTRKRGLITTIASCILVMAIVLLGCFIHFFVRSDIASVESIGYTIGWYDDHFQFSGELVDSGRAVAGVRWDEKDGNLDLEIRSTMASILNPSSHCDEVYYPSGEIHQVTLNNELVIWCDGETIKPAAARIYRDRTPYVGDVSAIQKLAADVGLYDLLQGKRSTQLQTSTEPYGWQEHLQGNYSEEEYEWYQEVLPRYAAALIATVDNLGYMEFDMNVSGKMRTIRVDESDANALLGAPSKTYIQTPLDAQNMIYQLMIHP